MIIKIGAAVVDGVMLDSFANSPIQQIQTTEGIVVLSRPVQVKGTTQGISVALAQQASVTLLHGYAQAQSPQALSFVDGVLANMKTVGTIIVQAVSLSAIDQAALSMKKLEDMTGETAIESQYAGSISFILV